MEDRKEEIKVEIEKNLLSGFTDGAKDELKKQAIKLTEHLVEETLVLVGERKVDKSDKPEITATDIKIAVNRPKTIPKKRKIWPIAIQVLSPAVLFFAGIFWNQQNEILSFIIIIAIMAMFVLHICSLATDQYE